MIGALFVRLDEVVEVRITGNNLLFRNAQYPSFVPIDFLRFDYEGVVKQYPDLKDYAEWRVEALKRFKEHIKQLDGENVVLNYVISEFGKMSYELKMIQKQGHRPQRFNGGERR